MQAHGAVVRDAGWVPSRELERRVLIIDEAKSTGWPLFRIVQGI